METGDSVQLVRAIVIRFFVHLISKAQAQRPEASALIVGKELKVRHIQLEPADMAAVVEKEHCPGDVGTVESHVPKAIWAKVGVPSFAAACTIPDVNGLESVADHFQQEWDIEDGCRNLHGEQFRTWRQRGRE
jgi:hypothetical protein